MSLSGEGGKGRWEGEREEGDAGGRSKASLGVAGGLFLRHGVQPMTLITGENNITLVFPLVAISLHKNK